MKSVLSSFSKRFTRPSPGGVRHIPFGFFRNTFSSATSSIGGMMISFLDGMKTFPPLSSFRYRGGRYMLFPL